MLGLQRITLHPKFGTAVEFEAEASFGVDDPNVLDAPSRVEEGFPEQVLAGRQNFNGQKSRYRQVSVFRLRDGRVDDQDIGAYIAGIILIGVSRSRD